MVTPIWLNGAGCAAAVPAVSVEANNKATNTFVFTDASLLSWISSCLTMRERQSVHFKPSRAFGAKKGKTSLFLAMDCCLGYLLQFRGLYGGKAAGMRLVLTGAVVSTSPND